MILYLLQGAHLMVELIANEEGCNHDRYVTQTDAGVTYLRHDDQLTQEPDNSFLL